MRRIIAGTLFALLALGAICSYGARPARAAVLAAGPVQEGPCIRLGGSLVIAAGQRCAGDGVAIGGDLIVRGTVQGNAVSIGGSVRVEGRVDGDVVSIGGGSLLQDGAEVGGDVTALGGRLYQAPQAVVRGNRLQGAWPFPVWPDGEDRPAASPWVRLEVGVLATLLTFGVCLLLAAALGSLWPRRTRAMIDRLRQDLWVSLGMGAASSLLVALFLPLVSILLLVVVVGIPVIPILYLCVGLVYAAGLSVAGLALGETLTAWKGGDRLPRWLRSTLGLAVLVPLAVIPAVVIPWVGPAWAVIVPGGGVGAMLLSRVGTTARPTGSPKAV